MTKDPNLKKCKQCFIPLNSEIISEKNPDRCKYCAEEKPKHDQVGHMTSPMAR